MTIREPECVSLKRRGAARIYQQLAGKSMEEQLDFWRTRNERIRARRKAKQTKHTLTETEILPT